MFASVPAELGDTMMLDTLPGAVGVFKCMFVMILQDVVRCTYILVYTMYNKNYVHTYIHVYIVDIHTYIQYILYDQVSCNMGNH